MCNLIKMNKSIKLITLILLIVINNIDFGNSTEDCNYNEENEKIIETSNILKTIETLTTHFIYNNNKKQCIELETNAYELIFHLKYALQNITTQIIIEHIINNQYINGSTITLINQLEEDIFNYNSQLYDNVIENVIIHLMTINNIYDFDKFIDIFGHKNSLTLRISCYSTILKILQSSTNKSFSEITMFKLAFIVKDIWQQLPNLSSVSKFMIKQQLIDKFPTSLRNLMFAKTVCLKNVAFNEYLNIGDMFGGSKDRRDVYTKIKIDDAKSATHWKIQLLNNHPTNNEYVFRILDNERNECLFASQVYFYEPNERNTFVWIPENLSMVEQKCNWFIELTDNDCYFKNYLYTEYLYAIPNAMLLNYSDRRHVATNVTKSNNKFNEAIWHIENCE